MSTTPSGGTAGDDRLPLKTAKPAELNRYMFRQVRDSIAGDEQREFFCECGRDDCHEWVFLTLDAYVALHDRGDAVLAEGHRLSQVDRARRLGADAEALRRQADHQVKRAKKILADQAPVRVLVVDDSETFRNLVADIVTRTPGFELVALASSGREALDLVEQFGVQFVLLDTSMPDVDGIETARRIRDQYPEVVVLLLTANRRRQSDDPSLTIEDKRDFSSQWIVDSWRRHRPTR